MGRQKKQHLKQRSDGRYVAVYHGKQFMGRSEEEALSARQRYVDLLEAGMKKSRTVGDFGLDWLPAAHPKASVSNSTYVGLAIHLEKLIRQIGDLRLDKVTPLDIKQVYSAEYSGKSNSYIKAAKQLFCALFDAAIANGYCKSNPARDRTARPHRGTYKGHRAISQEERYWIENLCTDHRAHAAAITMLYSGIRPQEMKSLKIERDVDFEKGIITLTEFVHIANDNLNMYQRTSSGKTENARRSIPLLPPVRKVLEGKTGYLITTSKGDPVSISAWKTVWSSYLTCMETAINGISKRWYGKTKEQRSLLEKGQLPPWKNFSITPYDLRVSFCTMCRNSDPPVELNTCIHWMGHSDAKMILRIYDQYSEERGKKEAEKLEKWLVNVQNNMQIAYRKPEHIDNIEP